MADATLDPRLPSQPYSTAIRCMSVCGWGLPVSVCLSGGEDYSAVCACVQTHVVWATPGTSSTCRRSRSARSRSTCARSTPRSRRASASCCCACRRCAPSPRRSSSSCSSCVSSARRPSTLSSEICCLAADRSAGRPTCPPSSSSPWRSRLGSRDDSPRETPEKEGTESGVLVWILQTGFSSPRTEGSAADIFRCLYWRVVGESLALLQGTKVCRYNWHSASSLGWPFPVLKYKYILPRKYTD